jgi:hypothetical protein
MLETEDLTEAKTMKKRVNVVFSAGTRFLVRIGRKNSRCTRWANDPTSAKKLDSAARLTFTAVRSTV